MPDNNKKSIDKDYANYMADYNRKTLGLNIIPADTQSRENYSKWQEWQHNPIPESQHENWKGMGAFCKGMARMHGRIWHRPDLVVETYWFSIDCDNQAGIDLLYKVFSVVINKEYNSIADLSQDFLIDFHADAHNKVHVSGYTKKPLLAKSSDRSKFNLQINSNLLDVDDLFNLSEIAFQVELALGKAQGMTRSNETIYETDFEAGKVNEIYANYRGDPYSFSTEYQLEEKLGKEVKRLSKVPIRNVQDVYNALTDRETLNKVLEQGLDEDYQRHRDELVNLFMDLKDKIKIEDLTLYEPIFTSNIQKSTCSICQDFANIHCTNCSDDDNDVWLCVDHWKQHKATNILKICL
jgi:hypothetical protein